MILKNLFRQWKVIIAAILAIASFDIAVLHAQLNTGKIEGTVRDMDTGAPLAGCQVVIDGTRLGNVTNQDGYFFILNTPPGRRGITFSYTGYQKTTVSNVLILAGQTITVDAAISSTVVELEGITIAGESQLLMPRDNTGTKHRMTAEKIENSPTATLEDLMVLEAGVQTGGEGGLGRGLRIRGGRIGEEGLVVDGVMVRNFTANAYLEGGGWQLEQESFSKGEDPTPLEFSTSSVEEVDIITGGFQAEYGNAQSGIINIVTKSGTPDIKGSIRFTTDEANPRTADYGYNQLQASVGGPIPGISNLFWHFSGELQGVEDTYPTHASEGFRGVNQGFVDRLNEAVRNDPVFGAQDPAFTLDMLASGYEFWAQKEGVESNLFSPVHPARLPNNWQDRTLGTFKATYAPFPGLFILVSENISRNQRSWDEGANYFYDGWITPEQLPTRDWQPGEESAFIPQSIGRRTKASNFLAGFDWSFLRRSDQNAILQFRYSNFKTSDINMSNLPVNYFREDHTFLGWSWSQIPFEVENYPGKQFPSSKEMIKKWFPDGVGNRVSDWAYHTPFGMETDYYLYRLNHYYTRERQHNFKADVDYQWNKANRAKFGVQFTKFANRRYNIRNSNRIRFDTEFAYKPELMGVYLQNRTDLGDFVFDYGLRYDGFKPVDNWGLKNGDPFGDVYKVKNFSSWSPRFDVAFPVTDRTQMRFSYGRFTQVPGMSFIFSNRNYGGLEYTRNDAFEFGLSWLISNDIILDVVSYYRDIDGNITSKDVFRDYYRDTENRRVREYVNGYANGDFGNIKGADITLAKRFSNNFAFNVSYTLQFSRTTGSYATAIGSDSETSGLTWATAFHDPTTSVEFRPPEYLGPINGDRTHMLSANLNYVFPEDFMSGSLANMFLNNLRLYGIFTLQSGQPLSTTDHTWVEDADLTWLSSGTSGVNVFRGRWTTNLDLRINKAFRLGSARRLSIFSEIFNVLNHKNPYPYPSTYTLKGFRGQTGGEDIVWSDDLDVRHKSWFKRDFNQDGVLTVEESAKGAMAASLMSSTMNKKYWGLARRVRFGIEFGF